MTPKLKLPDAVGVPLRIPAAVSVSPVGSAPEVTAQEYVPMPPLAVKVVVGYAMPWLPAGSVSGASKLSVVSWMTFTEKFAAAGVKVSGASAGVPVPLFAPATSVQVDAAVPLALVFAEAGLNELPAVPVANATGMLSMPALLLRVVAVTVTGAVVVVALSGMYAGDAGPVLVIASSESTPANGLNLRTVLPVLPPVVPANRYCGSKRSATLSTARPNTLADWMGRGRQARPRGPVDAGAPISIDPPAVVTT